MPDNDQKWLFDELTEEQLQELKELPEENDTKDTIWLNEFIKATDQWRIK